MKKKMYVAPQVEKVQLMAMGIFMGSTEPPIDPNQAPKNGAPIP